MRLRLGEGSSYDHACEILWLRLLLGPSLRPASVQVAALAVPLVPVADHGAVGAVGAVVQVLVQPATFVGLRRVTPWLAALATVVGQ